MQHNLTKGFVCDSRFDFDRQWHIPWQNGTLTSVHVVRTQDIVRKKIYITCLHLFFPPVLPLRLHATSLQLLLFLSGCYGFWCCSCIACAVSEKFGEHRCLPILDICSPAITACCGCPCCVAPAALALRVGIRHRYGIQVCEYRGII